MPENSTGVPWNAGYIVASGNLLADLRANVNAESQGRLQVARLYEMTDDKGVQDMLGFLLARDTMHQNQWIAAIKELEEKKASSCPVPFRQNMKKKKFRTLYTIFRMEKKAHSLSG